MKNLILILLCLGCVFLVFYFSWLPNPDIGLKFYFPKWLGHWTNANPNLRTAVPFVILGILAEIWLRKHSNRVGKRFLVLLLLGIIVTLAETGQLYLPKRHFDWRDIAWGITGSILGVLIAMALTKLIQRYRDF
jgi:VanZ family protein